MLEHRHTITRFHDLWYRQPFTWSGTRWRGVSCLKNPLDLWIYNDLIHQTRPQTIIETGTAFGGSALFFADLLDLNAIDGQVITIDITPREPRLYHPRLTYVTGSSTDSATLDAIRPQIRGPVLISLDSEHSYEHVSAELALYAPLVQVGGWLVVEDTDQDFTDGDPGPAGAVAAFLAQSPGAWGRDILCERYLLTMHPGGWLRRLA
jgi:cephalosporin hydroxylase